MVWATQSFICFACEASGSCTGPVCPTCGWDLRIEDTPGFGGPTTSCAISMRLPRGFKRIEAEEAYQRALTTWSQGKRATPPPPPPPSPGRYSVR
jgi:hypothetical protein